MKRIVNLILVFIIIIISPISYGRVSANQNQQPDLSVEKLEIGASGKLSVTLKNIGYGPLPDGWSARGHIWLDGQPNGFFSLQNPTQQLNGGIETAGGSSVYLLSMDIMHKTSVRCLVDYQDLNQGNNDLTTILFPLPDLVIDTINFDQTNKSISVTIRNGGNAATESSFVASISLNNQFFYAEAEVTVTLAAGAVTQLKFVFPSLPPSSMATITARADIYSKINETSDDNNYLHKDFTIVLPTPTPTVKPTPSPTPTPGMTPTNTPLPTPTFTPTPTPTLTPRPANPSRTLLLITAGPSVGSITADSAVISWSTSAPCESKVIFGAIAAKMTEERSNTVLAVEHAFFLQGLSPETVYALFVQSIEAAGRQVRSRTIYFKTASVALKKDPSISLVLADSLAGRKAQFCAETLGDSNVSRVVFSIDGKPFFIDYSKPFIWEFDTILFGEGMHTFSANAYDAAGNSAGATRDAAIRNQLNDALSPIKIRITSPGDRESVGGQINISAEISHDLDLRIDFIEFQVDGVAIQTQEFSPAISLTPVLSPVFAAVCRWNTVGYSVGEHIINVRVRDEAGNWRTASRRVMLADLPEPELTVTRDVRRVGNYFEITLHVTNNGVVDVDDLVMVDTCLGFQYLEKIEVRSMQPVESAPLAGTGRVSRTGGNHAATRIELGAYTLLAGETKTIRCYAIPVLADPYDSSPYPVFGTGFEISYATAEETYKRSVALAHGLSYAEFTAATRASDYLIMTCPSRLDEYNTAADVDALLVKLAELAMARNGVFGYLSPARTAVGSSSALRLLQRDDPWNAQMAPEWNNRGYLLIVGESEIVPAFNWIGVPLSDFPYSNTTGDEAPELRVGRIIGNAATEMIMPVQNSLDGVYFGHKALLISGPEDTWENHIMDTTDGHAAMIGMGLDTDAVHTEYWTTQRNLLTESIRIKNARQDDSQLRDLAVFMLRRMGVPVGAAHEDNLDGFTTNELAAWLYWAEVYTGSLTREEFIATADDPAAPLTGSVMWETLKSFLGKKGADYEFSEKELAAWLLWEETAPRGNLTAASLGEAEIDGLRRQLAGLSREEWVASADNIITPRLFALALDSAQSVQAASSSRGGYYPPWTYIYCTSDISVNQERNRVVKELAADGVDLIFFYGHGNGGSWGGVLADWTGTGSEISGISFGGHNPIVVGLSCLTGYYDEVGAGSVNDNPSISERFLQNGAAVYMGATKTMSYPVIDELLTEKIWLFWSDSGSVGNLLHHLKVQALPLGPLWHDFAVYQNLYGDPKYEMR